MSDQQHFEISFSGAAADTSAGSLLFVGNATVLLQYAGFTILTDPTFIHKHEQTWLGYGLHTTRLVDPALEIDDLPPLDLIVLSHFHGDHFDQVAEERLPKSVPIVTPVASAEELEKRGFTNTIPLRPWQDARFTRGGSMLTVTSTPGRHGPPLSDWVLPDVMGSVLEFQTGTDAPLRIYISGDTLVYDDLKEIPDRFPEIDLALLHLGGTRVFGILVTMDGKQGVELLQIIDPDAAIPIHYNDYDVFPSPLSEFQAEVDAAGLSDRVHYLSHGETYRFAKNPAPAATSPAWGGVVTSAEGTDAKEA